MADEGMKEFLTDLDLQRNKYRLLLEMVKEQDSLIRARQFDALMRLFERKRAVMEEIERVEGRMAPVKAKWPEVRDGLAEGERKEVETLLNDVGELLKQLLHLEEEGRRAMEEQQKGNAGEMKQMLQMKHARNAYGKGARESRFIDRTDAGEDDG